jgi:NAD(P)-dependent dehydrogenase (short-subunit alcohol dehydrogenase family)
MVRDMAFELRDHPVSVVAVWPGVVRTELADSIFENDLTVLRDWFTLGWTNIPGGADAAAKLTADDIAELVESTRFTGRAVAALAADPDVKKDSGRAFGVSNLADRYGFTDVDGRSPDGFRLRELASWPRLNNG